MYLNFWSLVKFTVKFHCTCVQYKKMLPFNKNFHAHKYCEIIVDQNDWHATQFNWANREIAGGRLDCFFLLLESSLEGLVQGQTYSFKS